MKSAPRLRDMANGKRGKPPGSPKTGGRQKGTPNKDRLALVEIATKALGRAPIEELCAFYISADEEGVRVSALKEICSYCYAKPRAVELTGKDGGALEHGASPEVAALVKDMIDIARAERK